MDLRDLLRLRRGEIIAAARVHGAHNVRVFGSVARGEETERSDIDILVELEPGRSLLDHAALMLELEAMLGRPVDVATEGGLKPKYRERILEEAIAL